VIRERDRGRKRVNISRKYFLAILLTMPCLMKAIQEEIPSEKSSSIVSFTGGIDQITKPKAL
jgi:hypothetical protein